MMNAWLITLLVCFVVYEIVEHLVLPLFWVIRQRGRQSICGPSGMVGKRCVVKEWHGTGGKVWVAGELWRAGSESPLMPGEVAVIQEIKGLTLLVCGLGADQTIQPSQPRK